MKIGPWTISGAQNVAKPAAAPPQYGEIGAPGTSIFGGQLTQQDYNPDLTAPACYDIYDKMRLSDGQVRAGLAVVKLPILRANWEVIPGSDSAEDKEIAEIANKDLRSMTTSYGAYMRQVLLMLDYGSMLFEPVWEVRDDGLIHIRKLAPRLPRTIVRWKVDENGGFAGVKQSAIKASGFELVDIPADKLVLFVNEQEGSNFRGVSMLRAAYKHWYFKDGLYRVDAIAKEKRAIGVDVMTIKAGAENKGALKGPLEHSAMTLHGHEKQYFIEDEENYTYRLETGSARIADALQSIEHHDLRILRSILAEFLNMGSGSTGSLAMHKDKSAFFLMSLEAISDNIAETMNAYLLKPWVDYNWRVKEYPRMKYSRLDTRDTAALATAVNQLMSVGALTASPDTEKELRVLLDIPDLEIDPNEVENEPAEDENPEIVAIVRRQVARVREQLASGKAASEIRLQYKEELVAAIAGTTEG